MGHDESNPCSDASREDKLSHLRAKYEIPASVHIFGADDADGLIPYRLKYVKRHISAFVRGTLTDDDFDHLYFYFEEIAECDYGWILAEKPLYFYDAPDSPEDFDRDVAVAELKAIGTRNKSRAKKLPVIFTMGGREVAP